MLPALLPHGQELLMTAASQAALAATLADLQAVQHEHDLHGSATADPADPVHGVQARITLVEQALAQAQVVAEEEPTRAVVGTTVEVHDGRKLSRYTLTVLAPADDPEGSIAVSVTSPVGLALHGSTVGETAVVELPDGRRRELQVQRISASA